jgi:hypothetical protein
MPNQNVATVRPLAWVKGPAPMGQGTWPLLMGQGTWPLLMGQGTWPLLMGQGTWPLLEPNRRGVVFAPRPKQGFVHPGRNLRLIGLYHGPNSQFGRNP